MESLQSTRIRQYIQNANKELSLTLVEKGIPEKKC